MMVDPVRRVPSVCDGRVSVALDDDLVIMPKNAACKAELLVRSAGPGQRRYCNIRKCLG